MNLLSYPLFFLVTSFLFYVLIIYFYTYTYTLLLLSIIDMCRKKCGVCNPEYDDCVGQKYCPVLCETGALCDYTKGAIQPMHCEDVVCGKDNTCIKLDPITCSVHEHSFHQFMTAAYGKNLQPSDRSHSSTQTMLHARSNHTHNITRTLLLFIVHRWSCRCRSFHLFRQQICTMFCMYQRCS